MNNSTGLVVNFTDFRCMHIIQVEIIVRGITIYELHTN